MSGNGRDAYFWGKECNVNAYDNATKPDNTDKVTFHKANMTEICGKHDLLYSRFSLHSIPEDIENLILSDMFSLPWDEPELLTDLGIKYDKDDMLMALQLAREIILNKRDLYVGVINES